MRTRGPSIIDVVLCTDLEMRHPIAKTRHGITVMSYKNVRHLIMFMNMVCNYVRHLTKPCIFVRSLALGSS